MAGKKLANGELTPMMKQYFDIKNQNEDCILMYRLGDFYEMFYEDAKIASKELELVLTGRDCGQEERAPMCGVPFHSAEGYIGRLISRGYKVAICEQTEDPALAKGLVSREVIRKVTPGTVIESSMLDDKRNNYIGAVYLESGGGALCFCDISTGETGAILLPKDGNMALLLAELGRYLPSELLLSDAAYSNARLMSFIRDRLNCHVEKAGEWRFIQENAEEQTKAQFTQNDCDILPKYVIKAAGALLSYLHETQQNALAHIDRLELFDEKQFMELDLTARRNLELTVSLRSGEKKGSLLWVLDTTKTPMGARLIRQWLEKPLLSTALIKRRQNAVSAMVQSEMARDELRTVLGGFLDMERVMARIVYGNANCRDLRAIQHDCTLLPKLKELITGFKSTYLDELALQIDLLSDVSGLIDSAISDEPPFSIHEGNMIKAGFRPDVDELRELLDGGTEKMADIERRERERTGISKLKVSYNRVFGYYIEISKSYIDKVPEDYIRKQTLVNCERYITQELKELEGEVLSAGDRLTALEFQVFTEIRDKTAGQIGRTQKTAAAVAAVDALCSFAEVAQKNHYVMPDVDDSDVIDIVNSRHPVVEMVLDGGMFVPNDVRLNCGDSRVYVITGPNMAGKSTYMRQVALITVMAQIGSFVPAQSAHIGVCDRVFTRVGASDDLMSGHSTFMVEMNEVADILKNATRKSLLILDEIGRGTSTFDGMAIARAVLEYVASKKLLGAKTLFATHYHELCQLENTVEGVKNYNILVKKRGDDIIFIKKIVPGGANDSYGIEVSKLAGLPSAVVSRAKEILHELESRQPKALPAPTIEDEPQLSLSAVSGTEITERLKAIEPDTLTPIEALGLLYDLCKKAKEC